MKHELTHPISKVLYPVVRGMCHHPDELEVIEQDHQGRALELRFEPHMGDIRVIIGKGGRQARALKFVAKRMGLIQGISVDVQIEESMRGQRDEQSPFQINMGYTMQMFLEVFTPVLRACFSDPNDPHETAFDYQIEDGGFKIEVDVPDEHTHIILAIGDIFYPFGKAHGRRIEIEPKKHAVRSP